MSAKNQTKKKTVSDSVKKTSKTNVNKKNVKSTSKNTVSKKSASKKITNNGIKKVNKNNNIKEEIKKEQDLKSVIIPTLIMIITFFFLIVGATYAYFSVSTTISGGSSKINTTVESVGVSMLKTGNNLSLNLTLVDMMKNNKDVTYYATADGVPSTTENSEIIGTAEVDGNGIMNCNYELEVNASGINNMYTAFQKMSTKSVDQLVLNVDGIEYDLYNVSFPLIINGTLENVQDGLPKDIVASFKIVNKSDIDQSGIAGTDIVLSFSVNEYNCEIVG